MHHRLKSRLAKSWLLPLCLMAGLLAVPSSAGAITSAQCAARVNDTPSKLVECIKKGDLSTHMDNLQAIADANPGPDGHPSRNSGEPGYLASANYVAQKMQDAGYNVHLQNYKFDYYAYTGIPTMSFDGTPLVLGTDWGPGQSLGSLDGTQTLTTVNNNVLPPTDTPSSTAGCDLSNFGPGVSGHPVLIQRGGCTFAQKVANAQAKGATGVIIFNEGNTTPDRTGLLIGSLGSVPTIPVVFVTFAIGNQMADEIKNGAPPSPIVDIKAIFQPNADDWNVIADSQGGDKNHTLVVDAHLDAIYGAGMLDNGSGSMAILDIAQMMKNVNPANHLRFIWFGGEELGLHGSEFYVKNLSSTQASHISYDLDADVFGTPNYLIGVLDPAAPDLFSKQVPETFPNKVYKPSQVARDQAIAFFDAHGFNHELISPNGTDAIWFNRIGIPASGLLTGQDCCKTPEEVQLFGGQTGNFEGNLGTTDGGCVDNPFRWCDNWPDNVDADNMTLMSKAMADMVVRQAFNTKIASSSSNTAVYPPKSGIVSDTRGHPAK
jgi:Zn-dependent M28 family amino/carboxypeptidase